MTGYDHLQCGLHSWVPLQFGMGVLHKWNNVWIVHLLFGQLLHGSQEEMSIHTNQDKDISYVRYEVERNHRAKPVFQVLLARAYGPGSTVIISHHLTVMCPKGVVHEIPSADTILFDPDIMRRVFGPAAIKKMAALARMRPEGREECVRKWLSVSASGDELRQLYSLQPVLTRAKTTTNGDEKRRKQRPQAAKKAGAANTHG